MSEVITIRRAAADDYQAMCQLLDEVDVLHREHVPWLFTTPSTTPRSAEFFADFLNGERAIAFVADVGHVVGVALGLLRPTPDFPVFRREQYAVIDAIAVTPAWRRRGTGTRLVPSVDEAGTTSAHCCTCRTYCR